MEFNTTGLKQPYNLTSFSYFLASIAIHVFLLMLLIHVSSSTSNYVVPQQTKKLISKVIQAQLVYLNDSKTIEAENMPKETSISTQNHSTINRDDTSQYDDKNEYLGASYEAQPNNQSDLTIANKPQTQNRKTKTKTLSALNSLEKLRRDIANENVHLSSKDSLQQYLDNKHYIPPSKTRFQQLPEAKAKKLEVNCNTTLFKGLTILGGLLGGSIKCNSFNGSQQYIGDRLEKLGKKKTE